LGRDRASRAQGITRECRMLLLAFPAPESSSSCLGSGDWPLDPQEVLLHPQDLEKLRVPAFGYVAINRNTGGSRTSSRTGKESAGRSRRRSASGKAEAAAICSTTRAPEDKSEDPFAFCRAVPDDSLAPGETRVPAWLLRAAGIRPRQHLSVSRASEVPRDDTLSEPSQAAGQQRPPARFRVDLCLFAGKQQPEEGQGVTGIGSSSSSSNSNSNARAIARRVSGCMVRAGSLLAAEILGEIVVLRVVAISDRGCEDTASDADDANSTDSSRHLIVTSDVEVALLHADDSKDFDGVTPSPSGSAVMQGREQSRRRPRQEHETPAPDCNTPSPSGAWGQRAPGLEAALSELHALVLLSVGGGGASGGSGSKSSSPRSSRLRWSDILPSGILLCGPSGVGKTLALDVLADDLRKRHGIHVIRLLGPQILAGSGQGSSSGGSGGSGMGESATGSPLLQGPLGHALAQARARAPSVLMFDELDALFDACGGEGGGGGGSPLGEGARAAAALLQALDRASAIEGVAVLGATRRSPGGKGGAGWAGLEESNGGGGDGAALPAAFRKPGRFDRCVPIGPPTEAQRERILGLLLTGATAAAVAISEEWAKRLSSVTPGMVGGDLERLVRTARARATQRGRNAGRRSLLSPRAPEGNETPRREGAHPAVLAWQDALGAVAVTVPRSLRGLDVASSGRPTWGAVGGFSEAKRRLQRLVQWPWLHPEAFARMGVSAPAGALLYGPSGCGKSLVAQVLATECLANFLWVRSSELLSRYLGETEAKLRALFSRARAAAPCILFLDELDAITAKRGDGTGDGDGGGEAGSVHARVLSTLLNEMDGVASSGGGGGVLVLAATNRRGALDAALLRPGRLHESVELGVPGREDREGVLRVHAGRLPLAPGTDLLRLSQDDVSGGLTCADLEVRAGAGLERD
ncbi:unnamed protein product, partial [Scytosiphon promiscuus]